MAPKPLLKPLPKRYLKAAEALSKKLKEGEDITKDALCATLKCEWVFSAPGVESPAAAEREAFNFLLANVGPLEDLLQLMKKDRIGLREVVKGAFYEHVGYHFPGAHGP